MTARRTTSRRKNGATTPTRPAPDGGDVDAPKRTPDRLIQLVKNWTNPQFWQYYLGRVRTFDKLARKQDKLFAKLRSHQKKRKTGTWLDQYDAICDEHKAAKENREEALAVANKLFVEWEEMRGLLEWYSPDLLGEFHPITSIEMMTSKQIDDRCKQMNHLHGLLLSRNAVSPPTQRINLDRDAANDIAAQVVEKLNRNGHGSSGAKGKGGLGSPPSDKKRPLALIKMTKQECGGRFRHPNTRTLPEFLNSIGVYNEPVKGSRQGIVVDAARIPPK
jgi:hypothetical protein